MADMMATAIEVEVNVMAARKSKRDERKVREDEHPPSPSSPPDPKCDIMMKTMEKMMENLSIDNRLPLREHQEPQIINPNFKRPAAQENRPKEARNQDENNQPIRAPFPGKFVADEAEEFPPNMILCFDLDEPIAYLTK